MEFSARLNQANGRLKAANVGVAIEAKGNRLYLRATLPAKSESQRSQSYQQRIALGSHANPWGVKLAEAEARKVGALVDCNQFSWQPYLKEMSALPTQTIADWILKFEQNYFQRRARNPKSEYTWNNDYSKVFKHLPLEQPLTLQLLGDLILKTAPDTRSRKRYCTALAALAKFANVDLNVKPLIGSYGAKQLTPRDLPEDETIARWFPQIKDPAWRWAYGAIATFGLRPHEIFHLDTTDLEQGGYTLSVLDDTKTGARRVWACYPEWIECFGLRAPLVPAVTGKNNGDLGKRCSNYFRRQGLPFKPYDLRHCWAVRTLEFGLDVSLAAQQMGHSVKVHTDTYHRWISDRHHQRAFDLLMMRSDRPKAPMLF